MAHSVNNSSNRKQSEGSFKEAYEKYLDMTGDPVLVQNELGIFYGLLAKADTRSGTALLRHGFAISPDRHITFAQYLTFLSDEVYDMVEQVNEEYIDEDGQIDDDFFGAISELRLPDEIQISMDTLDQHRDKLTITDYASEGIYKVQFRTSDNWNTDDRQSIARLISLTNVLAIVPVNSGVFTIDHKDFEDTRYGESDHSTDAVYPLEKLFEGAPQDIEITPQDTFRYMFAKTYSGIAGEAIDELFTRMSKEESKTPSSNPLGLAEGKELPKLVVNTRQRVELYRNLKKTQSDEQAK